LVEERGAEVNQQDRERGWTALHHAAAQAHITSRPYMQIFEYLLQHGADPALLTDAGWDHLVHGRVRPHVRQQEGLYESDSRDLREKGIFVNGRATSSQPLNRCSGRTQVGAPQSIYDVCVEKGRGWRPGRVRGFLRAYVAKNAGVPKRRAFRYIGPPMAPVAAMLQRIYHQLPPVYPPDDWVPPPEPGLEGSAGTRLVEEQPWRPVCAHTSDSMMHTSVRDIASRAFICLHDV
jgi:hypothetical protein